MYKKTISLCSLLSIFIASTANAQFISNQDRNNNMSLMFQQEPILAKEENKEFTIKLIVNGEILSNKDIDDRIKAFALNTQIPVNSSTIDMVTARVLKATTDEIIKLQEATKEGIKVSDKDIMSAIENFAAKQNMSIFQFRNDLAREGVDFEVFKNQIKSDLSWVKLVRQKNYGKEASQKDIDKAIEIAKNEINTEKYKISEIIIPKEDSKNIEDLIKNLENDPRFELYAMQFSNAPSSAKGGDLGWVKKNSLLPKIYEVIKNMQDGDISKAVEIDDNYHIIKLEKTYNPEDGLAQVPSREEVKYMIETERLEEFATNYINKIRQKAIIEMKD